MVEYFRMKEKIPDFLKEKLIHEYGEDLAKNIINGYYKRKSVTLRINTLKSDIHKVIQRLEEEGITYKKVEWYKDALIIDNVREDKLQSLDIYNNGEIYLQSLSSMLPPIILDPKENENILDMAAAPGGKTTQISAISGNNAMITACEKNKIRLERLKYNIEKQGARVNIISQDARELDEYFSFDKILLDSPCSGSGTENIFSEKFTEELLNRSVKLQEKLLEKAIKIVKPKGEVIYSTCSILKEENEKIIDRIMKKYDVEIVEIKNPKRYTTFTSYNQAEESA